MSVQRNILTVDQLKVSFEQNDTFIAVDKVSFKLDKGKTLAIVGESGSGKSLSALSIMGLLPDAALVKGAITLSINDQTHDLIETREVAKLRGNVIGMIFQEPMSALNPIMKVGEQLLESIVLHQKLPKQLAKATAIDWLQKVKLPAPEKIFHRYPHQLSGGQKQRVMIAMAMCNDPDLLLADEPTTALDVTVQKEVIALMAELQKEHHAAMVFITHDLNLAASIADDIMVMYKGKVVERGEIQKVISQPEHQYTKALLACRPSANNKGTTLPIVDDYIKGDVFEKKAFSSTITDEVLLDVKKLCVYYEQGKDWRGNVTDYFKAVDDVSFQLKKGEVLGLVGESGCGKSTISKALMGLVPIQSGNVSFEGKEINSLSAKEWRMLRQQMQIIFQDPFSSLNPRMTVGDMLMEPMRAHDIAPNSKLKTEVAKLLDMVHLSKDAIKRYPHQFSGGQRQRLGIARALSLKPKFVICDESVSALDVSVQAQILNLLKELQVELGLSYLFISHDLNVVHYISDRVMVMHKGRIIEQGDAHHVLHHPVNEYTQKLIAAMP